MRVANNIMKIIQFINNRLNLTGDFSSLHTIIHYILLCFSGISLKEEKKLRVLGRVWFMALVLKTSYFNKIREFKSHSARLDYNRNI